ncbi:Rne/Rng family ribonuclease [Robiginitomaculum antarcticum]|uniref:Rne/Rng family ribonuclease n=1 Tax=Robiginitomaculum antarcticum TaxID=437507 RepID=UPI000380847F|nr:ribonuclease E/G [Robiginitomaculum antarcticum]
MSKKMLIDASHPEETRVVVVNQNRVEELDFESAAKRQLRGNVYLAKVTRVEPSLQAAFVEFGGNRHGFLAFSEIHPDYYQIPHADKVKLLEAEAAHSRDDDDDDDDDEDNGKGSRNSRNRSRSKPASAKKGARVSKKSSSDDEGKDPLRKAAASFAAALRIAASNPDDEIDPTAQASDNFVVAKNLRTKDFDPADIPDDLDDHDDDEIDAELAEDAADEDDEEVAVEQAKMDKKRRQQQLRRRYKIQEVVKRGQVLLVQAVKEERGNKGAALTTYLSLAGRYCVLMPNTPRGGGISRKISNGADRKRLKGIMSNLEVPKGMGVIVRTAGAKRTQTDIERDFDYLARLWETIRKKTLESSAPSLIHQEGDLVKRALRDMFSKDTEQVLVAGREAYEQARDFIEMLMPAQAENVVEYTDDIPLFLRYQVEQQIEASLEPVAQLKSGGYLVIHPTEALVSVDVNSGRSTKERNVERTALKTNLEAAEEVARQMRLRDLAGLIVIDFIDMDENRNNRAVEKRMKDMLSTDRARVQMGRISQFGLMEISRQRRRRSLLEGSSASCEHCGGVGRKRSVESSALKAIRAVEEEGVRNRAKRIRLKVSPNVALYLFNEKRDLLSSVDTRFDMFTEIFSDNSMHRPEFEIERLEMNEEKGDDPVEVMEKEAKRNERQSRNSSPKRTNNNDNKSDDDDSSDTKAGSTSRNRRGRRRNSSDTSESDSSETQSKASAPSPTKDDASDSDESNRRKRRRRGRRGGRGKRRDEGETSGDNSGSNTTDTTSKAETSKPVEGLEVITPEAASKAAAPKRRRTRKSAPKKESGSSSTEGKPPRESKPQANDKPAGAAPQGDGATPKRQRVRRKAPNKDGGEAKPAAAAKAQAKPAETKAAERKSDKPKRTRTRKSAPSKAADAPVKDAPKAKPAARKKAPAKAQSPAPEPEKAQAGGKPKRVRVRRKAPGKLEGAQAQANSAPNTQEPGKPKPKKKKGFLGKLFNI